MKAPKDRDFTKEELQSMGIYIHPSELESDLIYLDKEGNEIAAPVEDEQEPLI